MGLIEDKASGTQRIQELIEQGLHAVTRYQPQTDKIMRMHAQTAVIENGFVYLPKEAGVARRIPARADGLPKGQADDQVDSTGARPATRPARAVIGDGKEARAPPAVVTPPATHPIVEATLGGARAAVPHRLSPDCAENLRSC